MRINEVTYEKLKTPLKVNGNLNSMVLVLKVKRTCEKGIAFSSYKEAFCWKATSYISIK